MAVAAAVGNDFHHYRLLDDTDPPDSIPAPDRRTAEHRLVDQFDRLVVDVGPPEARSDCTHRLALPLLVQQPHLLEQKFVPIPKLVFVLLLIP